ncbi:hypothetical protein NHX12_027096, partial [Muraenolepis orangiensis]
MERTSGPRMILVILLVVFLQWAVGVQAQCQAPGVECDFTCDCPDCRDENNCGYSGSSFACDFEEAARCGWTSQDPDPDYQWEARQSGGPPSGGPPGGPQRTLLRLHHRHRLRLVYGCEGGLTDLGRTPLWASVSHESDRDLLVWRPGSSSVNGWREANIFLGRIPGPFRVHLHSQRAVGRRDDVAVDQLEFLDCALPGPSPAEGCAEGMLPCVRGGCVERRQVCDGTDDCGDGTDERSCVGYQACDFEDGMCEWDLRSLSPLKWTRTTQNDISTTDPLQGPGRDHSTNSASGHFLYVTVPEGGLKADWAAFQSPLLKPTNRTHPCKLVMYSHQFGPRAGGLSVLVAGKQISPVWERGGSLGDLWVKAEVEVVTNTAFYILVVAAIRDAEYGGVGLDSLRLSPGCLRAPGNMSAEAFPSPPEKPCTPDTSKMCDFVADCSGAKDEAKCGDFTFSQGSSGWTDRSVGSQGWRLHQGANSTTRDDYLYVSEAPGQQLTEAQSRTPPLGPSGPACSLSFSYALTGSPLHIGELSIWLIDSLLGLSPPLWQFSGRTGSEETAWRSALVAVGHRRHRFQLALGARAATLHQNAKIRVKDVRYLDCHANYLPFSPTALSCNFEEGLCGWYQDHGRSLVVDFWDPSLRGSSGRLLSFPQAPFSGDRCLTFFYKLYGSQTGVLNVKVTDSMGFELLLWTRSGAHGNFWHQGHCTVPHQLTRFQLVFEVVRSGFDGRVALDDVALLERPCTVPRLCSFEGQRCGYTGSGDVRWGHWNGHQAGAAGGPKTDHTMETELGYYMMVHSGVDDLPLDGQSSLSSPVQPGSGRTHCVHFCSNMVDWQLEFEVVGVGGKDTHVAIDDVSLLTHPCESEGSRCTLEQGLCGWSNTNHQDRDKLDWDITSTETDTHYTLLPSHDHTLGTERGHFLFFPTSSRTLANQNAWLVSVHLPPTKGTCLRFWAHKPSSADSVLNVWRLTGSSELHQLLKVEEVGAIWVRFHVVLEGVRGSAGLLALDDIQYTVGTDSGGQAGSNAAGITASVIVVLLLLGTLAALLVFYLRNRQKDDHLLPGQALGQSEASSGASGFSNEVYSLEDEDRVTVPPIPIHPMAAGFNNMLPP